MATLTKDALKTALVNHGVEMNLSTAKKDELLALYEEIVVPNEEKAGEFSSDDEEISIKKAKKVSKTSSRASKKSESNNGAITEENSFIVGDVKVDELNDEELIKYLQEYDIEVGPIVDSTRTLYQKKLAIVMREHKKKDNDETDNNGSSQQQNGHKVTNGNTTKSTLEEFSADEEVLEEEEVQPSAVIKKSSRQSTPATKKSPLAALGSSLRQRFSGSSEKKAEKPERFTPTPRRSIHSYKITETTKQTMTKSKDGLVTHDITYNKETSETKGELEAGKLALVRKVLPGVLMLLILAALAYYVYTKRT